MVKEAASVGQGAAWHGPKVHEPPVCVASARPSRAPGAPAQQPNKPMKLTVAFGARSLSARR